MRYGNKRTKSIAVEVLPSDGDPDYNCGDRDYRGGRGDGRIRFLLGQKNYRLRNLAVAEEITETLSTQFNRKDYPIKLQALLFAVVPAVMFTC